MSYIIEHKGAGPFFTNRQFLNWSTNSHSYLEESAIGLYFQPVESM